VAVLQVATDMLPLESVELRKKPPAHSAPLASCSTHFPVRHSPVYKMQGGGFLHFFTGVQSTLPRQEVVEEGSTKIAPPMMTKITTTTATVIACVRVMPSTFSTLRERVALASK